MTGSFSRMFDGLRRVAVAPGVVVVVWLTNLAIAIPAAVVVADRLEKSIGPSEAGERLLEGFDFGWHGELMAEGSDGFLSTFRPQNLVGGGWLVNLDLWWSGRLFDLPSSILAFGGLFALVWLILSGGALAHFHRPPRRFGLAAFLADGGSFFFRFLRLAVLAAPLYYGVFRLARWLFGRIESATIDVTVERTVFGLYLVAAVLVVFLLVTIKMTFDYAKISIVVGERRSSLLAALSGLGFVLRRPLRCLGLVVLFGSLGFFLIVLREVGDPGVSQASTWAIVGALVLGQLFLVLRFGLRLALLGAELTLYEEVYR